MKIQIDGLSINYKFSGQGEKTAVILQGWGTNLALYDSVAALLNDKFRVLQFDFPGFGDSEEPKEPWNVEAYTQFFIKLLEALHIKKATLIGHSYGGRVIIKLAAKENCPVIIENIVLIDSAGILPKKTFRQKYRIKRYKLLKKLYGIGFIYSLFPELIDDWRSRQGSEDYKNASKIMKACLVLAVNEDLSLCLPKIRQDTLLIWGENDTATPLKDGKTMEKLLPSSGLAVIKNAGHFSFLEKPEVFKGIIRAYFG